MAEETVTLPTYIRCVRGLLPSRVEQWVTNDAIEECYVQGKTYYEAYEQFKMDWVDYMQERN